MWYGGRLCKAGLLRNFPTFLPDKQTKIGSLRRTEEFLPGTSLLLNAQKEDLVDIFAPKWSSQTHIDLSSSSTFTTKTLWIDTLITTSTSKYRHLETKNNNL